jgi:hypothetical protein
VVDRVDRTAPLKPASAPAPGKRDYSGRRGRRNRQLPDTETDTQKLQKKAGKRRGANIDEHC